MLYVVTICIGTALLVASIALFLPVMRAAQADAVEQRNRAFARARREGTDAQAAAKKAEGTALDKALESAGIASKGSHFVVGCILAAVLGAFLGFGIGRGVVGALVGILVVLLGAIGYVRHRVTKRKHLFEIQLGECLPMVAEGIRGGMTFERSIRNVAEYMEEPIKGQFKMLALERSYGTPLPDAVEHMAQRVKSRDMDMLASVVAVQAETGGKMADILDSIADTIQRRNHLRRHVAAVTADGRLSAGIIGAIPIVLVIILNLIAPQYAGVLFTTVAGRIMLVVSGILIAIGLLFIRRLYQIKIY